MDLSRESDVGHAAERAAAAAGIVLLTLASAQFLMTLDSSVMNVSIATVAKDVGTTVTGIQTAITFYTLVMASLMITGGKLGQILGRKRAFAIGCAISTWRARYCPRSVLGSSFMASCAPGHGGSSSPRPTRRSGWGRRR
jgi:MFS family permease